MFWRYYRIEPQNNHKKYNSWNLINCVFAYSLQSYVFFLSPPIWFRAGKLLTKRPAPSIRRGARFPNKHATKENLSSTRQTRQEIQKNGNPSFHKRFLLFLSLHPWIYEQSSRYGTCCLKLKNEARAPAPALIQMTTRCSQTVGGWLRVLVCGWLIKVASGTSRVA